MRLLLLHQPRIKIFLLLKAKQRERLLHLTNDLSHLSPGLLLLKTDEFSWTPPACLSPFLLFPVRKTDYPITAIITFTKIISFSLLISRGVPILLGWIFLILSCGVDFFTLKRSAASLKEKPSFTASVAYCIWSLPDMLYVLSVIFRAVKIPQKK